MEKNPGGYLSATEIPLSRLYMGMAAVFFSAAMIWVYTLMKHRYSKASWEICGPFSFQHPGEQLLCWGVRLP